MKKEEVNMLTKAKIDKALDAFYWGDTGPNAKDEYTSGYKLLHKDEETINLVGEVLHTLQLATWQEKCWYCLLICNVL